MLRITLFGANNLSSIPVTPVIQLCPPSGQEKGDTTTLPSPYVLFTYNDISHQFSTIQNETVNPVWNQTIDFRIVNMSTDKLVSSVYNRDDSTHLGFVEILVSECKLNCILSFPLCPDSPKENVTGTLLLTLHVMEDSGNINLIDTTPLEESIEISAPLGDVFPLMNEIKEDEFPEEDHDDDDTLDLRKLSDLSSFAYASWLPRSNVTDVFIHFHKLLMENKNVFDSLNGQQFVYLYVPGLYHGKFPGETDPKPGYERRIEAFSKLGLDMRIVPVATDGSVEVNSSVIFSSVSEVYTKESKRVVIIGHSKGAVDITGAVTLFPDIHPMIRAVLSMQGPFLGSPLASDLLNKPPTSTIINKLIRKCLDSDPLALRQLTAASRLDFLSKHPYPSKAVSALSFVSTNPDSSLRLISKYVKRVHGDDNDGAVTASDGIIPGSKVVNLPGLDHHTKGRIGSSTLTLLTLVAVTLKTTEDHLNPPPSPLTSFPPKNFPLPPLTHSLSPLTPSSSPLTPMSNPSTIPHPRRLTHTKASRTPSPSNLALTRSDFSLSEDSVDQSDPTTRGRSTKVKTTMTSKTPRSPSSSPSSPQRGRSLESSRPCDQERKVPVPQSLIIGAKRETLMVGMSDGDLVVGMEVRTGGTDLISGLLLEITPSTTNNLFENMEPRKKKPHKISRSRTPPNSKTHHHSDPTDPVETPKPETEIKKRKKSQSRTPSISKTVEIPKPETEIKQRKKSQSPPISKTVETSTVETPKPETEIKQHKKSQSQTPSISKTVETPKPETEIKQRKKSRSRTPSISKTQNHLSDPTGPVETPKPETQYQKSPLDSSNPIEPEETSIQQ